MPCTTAIREGQTLTERISEVDVALKRLEAALGRGTVKLLIGPTGGVALVGWIDRSDITDCCAIRALTAQGSVALRQAIARAEAVQGRRVNPLAVAAGVHSHDGGATWNRGHR